MGSLWGQIPKLSTLTIVFAVPALGLPSLASFMGAFMVLLGVLPVQPWAASLAAAGMILVPIYALIIMQKGFLVQQATGQYDP